MALNMGCGGVVNSPVGNSPAKMVASAPPMGSIASLVVYGQELEKVAFSLSSLAGEVRGKLLGWTPCNSVAPEINKPEQTMVSQLDASLKIIREQMHVTYNELSLILEALQGD